MAFLLVVPVVCPISGDSIEISQEELARLGAGPTATVEFACPCGAGGQVQRTVVATVVDADEVRTEDTTKVMSGRLPRRRPRQ